MAFTRETIAQHRSSGKYYDYFQLCASVCNVCFCVRVYLSVKASCLIQNACKKTKILMFYPLCTNEQQKIVKIFHLLCVSPVYLFRRDLTFRRRLRHFDVSI